MTREVMDAVPPGADARCMGDIGVERREVEVVPLEGPGVPEPVREPAPAPVPERVPVPA